MSGAGKLEQSMNHGQSGGNSNYFPGIFLQDLFYNKRIAHGCLTRVLIVSVFVCSTIKNEMFSPIFKVCILLGVKRVKKECMDFVVYYPLIMIKLFIAIYNLIFTLL